MQDRILERTLGQVRAEKARDRRRRAGVVAAVGATLAAAMLAGGVYLGRHSLPGERVLVATAADGVRMTATVAPADGWLRLRVVVDGVHAGEKCRLVVTDRGGRRYVAGGWVASRLGDSAPADTAPAGSAPTGSTPSGSTPASSTSTGTAPAGRIPTGRIPAGRASTGNTPASGVPTGTVLAGAAMVDPDELATIDVVTVDGRVLVRAAASE